MCCCVFSMILQAQDQVNKPVKPKPKVYNIEQAISDRAQLNTMAFSGLAFVTGSLGADCFFPPGKVADYFGFQFMRDNDTNELGHNTDFLKRIATNVLVILDKEQLQLLLDLANKQAFVFDSFALKRMVLIKAFRTSLNNEKQLNKQAVVQYTSMLYEIDAKLSYERALLFGKISQTLNDKQKAELAKLDFSNSSTWQMQAEVLDKRSMSHRGSTAYEMANLGLCKALTGDKDASEKYFSAAELYSTSKQIKALVAFNRAIVSFESDKFDDARHYFESAATHANRRIKLYVKCSKFGFKLAAHFPEFSEFLPSKANKSKHSDAA